MTAYKKLCLMLCAFFACSIFAVAGNIHWTVTSEPVPEESGLWRLRLTGKIDEGYHSYPLSDEFSGPAVEFSELQSCSLEGTLKDLSRAVKEGDYMVVNDAIVLTQDIRLEPGATKALVKGTCITICCAGNSCFPPEYIDFEHEINASESAVAPASVEQPVKEKVPFDWSLILQAIL